MVEVPMISIKVKGLEAIQALGSNGQLFSSLNLKGAAALAQDAATHAGEIEAIRVGAIKGGKLITVKAVEMEGSSAVAAGKCPIYGYEGQKLYVLSKGSAAGSAAGKAAGGKALGAAACPALAAKSKTVVLASKGAAAGVGAGLSAWVPVIALGAFGLGALAYYFYRRNRELNEELEQDFAEEAAIA